VVRPSADRAAAAQGGAEPPQTYEVIVTPRVVVVEGSAGYFGVFTRDQLAGSPGSPLGQL
jgi:hypothetical protein